MNQDERQFVEAAKAAALEALLHNAHGTYHGLPRTAGWGYPEPYTRDLMICLLGVLVSGNETLLAAYENVLRTLAKNQSPLGHISSLVHDPEDGGASDCTPLFLVGVGIWRHAVGDKTFLSEAADKALTWMRYQSPSDRVIVAQLPTSDWRDEQWVLGYGLFVNTLAYTYLKLFGRDEEAAILKSEMQRFAVNSERQHRHVHEGLVLKHKPYYAFWSYKVYQSERFDLLGNSLAILSGIASPTRAASLVAWIEHETGVLRQNGQLGAGLPPNFFPYIQPDDPDWIPRYENYNRPGEYHNGGIWPFISGFYVAALVAAGKHKVAEQQLLNLTHAVKPWRHKQTEFGFNEWLDAFEAKPRGQDWQSWSAAMYLYAAACVERKTTPFFESIRG